MKSYKNRKEVPQKYKWDLEFLLEGKTIEEQMKKVEKLFKDIIKVKDTRFKTEKEFLSSLKINDKLSMLMNKVNNYLSNSLSQNVTDPEINSLIQKYEFMMYQLSQEYGPEEPRIFANETKIRKYIKSPALRNYKQEFEKVLETKKHQLPKVIQEFRNKASRGDINTSTPFSILKNAELVFKNAVDSKGKEHKVGHDTISKLRKNKDTTLRKTASLNYRDAHLQVKQTLSNFLFQHFKETTVEAKIHKHKDTISYLIYPDRSSEKLLLTLYDAVQKNVPLHKKSHSLHKKAYKGKYGKAMTKYDGLMPIVNVKTELTIEEQQKLVLASFKPFGKEYTDVIKTAFKDKWIDYKAYPGKRTGAYSIGSSYGLNKKLILMNDTNDINAAETLAHELGHSMHSYFSDKHQSLWASAYPIFIAEIASIFNELMFFDYMLKTSTNDKLKLQIMHQIVGGFEGTVFRQVEWSNYEYDMYRGIEEGKSLSTFEAITDVYFNNAKKYAIKTLKEKDKAKMSLAITVPHFYYGFYVYKYAIGQLVASIFFNRYKTQGKKALDDYIDNFLSKGRSLDPIELLKSNGIDLEDPKTFDEGFATYADHVKKYGELINKIYKNIKSNK